MLFINFHLQYKKLVPNLLFTKGRVKFFGEKFIDTSEDKLEGELQKFFILFSDTSLPMHGLKYFHHILSTLLDIN
jgi:hypothetical protein